MGLLGVARANTAVGVSPETFLLLLQLHPWQRNTGKLQRRAAQSIALVLLLTLIHSANKSWFLAKKSVFLAKNNHSTKHNVLFYIASRNNQKSYTQGQTRNPFPLVQEKN
jgi:hypothetical protein